MTSPARERAKAFLRAFEGCGFACHVVAPIILDLIKEIEALESMEVA